MSIETLEQPIEESSYEQEITELKNKIAELEAKNIELEKIAFTDLLTGINDRRGLERDAKFILPEKHIPSQERRPSHEQKRDITMLVVDLDNFKIINDAFEGHEGGDRILKEAAQFLKSKIRDNDILARIGGEEFAIIFHDFDGPGVMKKFFDPAQGHSRLGFTTDLGGEKMPINFSGGVTMLKPHETIENLWDVVKRADKGLYKAKEDEIGPDGEIIARGRNRILFLDSDEAQE